MLRLIVLVREEKLIQSIVEGALVLLYCTRYHILAYLFRTHDNEVVLRLYSVHFSKCYCHKSEICLKEQILITSEDYINSVA